MRVGYDAPPGVLFIRQDVFLNEVPGDVPIQRCVLKRFVTQPNAYTHSRPGNHGSNDTLPCGNYRFLRGRCFFLLFNRRVFDLYFGQSSRVPPERTPP